MIHLLAAISAEPTIPQAVEQVEALAPGTSLALAIAFLLAAAALTAVEFIVISGGLLGGAAMVCALLAIGYAFAAGPLAGWVFSVLTPIIAFALIKTGVTWMQKSSLIPKAEITADAGYHHTFANTGLAPGHTGILVTDAYPSGRARFTGSAGPIEIDVFIRGGSAKRGDAVIIKSIDGPTVTCAPLSSTPAPSSTSVQPTTVS